MTTDNPYAVTVPLHPHGEADVLRWDLLLAQQEFWVSADLTVHRICDMSDQHLREARAWLLGNSEKVCATAELFSAGFAGYEEYVGDSYLARALKWEDFHRAVERIAELSEEDAEYLGAILDELIEATELEADTNLITDVGGAYDQATTAAADMIREAQEEQAAAWKSALEGLFNQTEPLTGDGSLPPF